MAPAAKGVEAYTVGLVHMWDFFAFQAKMKGAKDVAEGDDALCAGGITSIIRDKDTGEAFICRSTCMSCSSLVAEFGQVYSSLCITFSCAHCVGCSD